MSIKKILDDLRAFVEKEHKANFAKLHEIWQKPTSQKLESGETQGIFSIEVEDKKHLILTLGIEESRFREGDMICLHRGNPNLDAFVRQAVIEAESDGEWLIRGEFDEAVIRSLEGPYFADTDVMDLKPFFDTALDDIASSSNGRNTIIPLLAGELDTNHIFTDNFDNAADFAENEGLNEKQTQAVALGVAAKYLACIQGPPGTGKTRVISLIAKLLVSEGQRVLITSHTHMAINNALNKISEEQVPVIKVGANSTTKGLNDSVPQFNSGSDWEDRPDSGYAIGATPFSTCSMRLENFDFDTVIFDEASQITVPLAIMAMRKAKRFVFVGDHKQLPPVVLSKSVLDETSYSVFSKLILQSPETSVMLSETYRMNQWLAHWPSKQYYQSNLVSTGKNKQRRLSLNNESKQFSEIFSNNHPFTFIPSPGLNTRTHSDNEAKLVTDLIKYASTANLALKDIGVVTPYRNHGKLIRKKLAENFGFSLSKDIVTDTVERMQGQERELIIISMCSTDKQFIQSVAHFLFQPERLNVAITRPTVKLILIGPELPENFTLQNRQSNIHEYIAAYKDLVKTAWQVRLGGDVYG